jgi:hypothetical protein
MEKPKRARKRKLDTAKADLQPPLCSPGGQGVHREVESAGHEEKYRAVIEGATPKMNWSAKGGTGRACVYEAKAFSFARCNKVFADGTVRKNSA